MPFQNRRSFCGIPDWTSQPLVVVGAPTDCATSFRSGARMAPASIRDASLMLTDGSHEMCSVDLTQLVGDAGDWPLVSGDVSHVMALIQRLHGNLLPAHVVTLGGDHLISLPILRSLRTIHPPLALVHFDAHCDTWSEHFGSPYGHGTWLYNAIEEQLVDPSSSISIGVRSPADSESREFLQSRGGTTLSARIASREGVDRTVEWIQKQVGFEQPVYLSLDIDCLDPSHAPGTGTPEIGGLTSMFVSEVLDQLGDLNWVGMDLVEVNPSYDTSGITSLAGATFVWQYLSQVAHRLQ